MTQKVLDELQHKVKDEESLIVDDLYKLKNFLRIAEVSNELIKAGKLEEFESKRKLMLKFIEGNIITKGEVEVARLIMLKYGVIAATMASMDGVLSDEAMGRLKNTLEDTKPFEQAFLAISQKGGRLEELIVKSRDNVQSFSEVITIVRSAIQICTNLSDRIVGLIRAIEELNQLPGIEFTDEIKLRYGDGENRDRITIEYLNKRNKYLGDIEADLIQDEDLSRMRNGGYEKFQAVSQEIKKRIGNVERIYLYEVHAEDIPEHLKGIGAGKRLYALLARRISSYGGILTSGGKYGVASTQPDASDEAKRVWNSESWPSDFLKIDSFLAYLPGLQKFISEEPEFSMTFFQETLQEDAIRNLEVIGLDIHDISVNIWVDRNAFYTLRDAQHHGITIYKFENKRRMLPNKLNLVGLNIHGQQVVVGIEMHFLQELQDHAKVKILDSSGKVIKI